ncbi:hypothetical protein TYRP_009035 [Tyrophagus putrescentiae]|nr:hypothetical protein TYRP_009035 [Tyrophagus putrescentiae]
MDFNLVPVPRCPADFEKTAEAVELKLFVNESSLHRGNDLNWWTEFRARVYRTDMQNHRTVDSRWAAKSKVVRQKGSRLAKTTSAKFAKTSFHKVDLIDLQVQPARIDQHLKNGPLATGGNGH